MKKIIPVLLCLVFVLSAITAITVSAASQTQDGLEATLTLSKAEYSANENIAVTLTVKNTGAETVKNVQTEIVLPNGVSVVSGNLKQSAFDLAANETKTVEVTAKKGAASANTNTNTNSNSNSNNTAGSTTTAPQTADSFVVVPVVIMIISGIAVAVISVKYKWIGGKGIMSIFLCVMMLGTMILPVAVNADSARKEFTVTESFKIDGKSETVKAVISYGEAAANDNSDNGNNSADTDDSANNGNNGGNSGDQNGESSDTDEVVQKPTDTNPEGEEILGEGSVDTPYMEIPDSETMTVTTVAIPAGGVLYYDIYRVGGMILTIEDANAYVEYNGNRYDAQNGVVSIQLENALASDTVSFAFGNNGSSDVSFVVSFSNATGSYQNPTIIETLGEDNQISLEEGNDTGHYYKYYAEQTGTIRFYLTASVDSIIVVTNNRNSAQRSNDGDELFTDENGDPYIELDVEQGDEIMITVGAKPNKRGKFPATDITWRGNYI